MWWQKYLGIPFERNKSSFQSCDCAGLIFLVLENELKMKVERTSSTDFHAKEKQVLMRQYFDLLNEIQPNEAKEFDIFFQADGIFHTGFIVDEKYILQASLDKGVHLSNRNILKMKPTTYHRIKR